MFQIYLTKSAQDAMSRDETYLLSQTMRIFNTVRLFITVADDIRRRGPDDIVNQKKYMDLLFYHAANLSEVLTTLKEDLFPRYKSAPLDAESLEGLSRWEQRIKDNDETVRVLATIRNKHSFHIGHDPYYGWKYITDAPAEADKLIAVGETMQGLGWFFTWDNDIILAFLRDHAFTEQGKLEDGYMKVKKIIDEASVDLYKLFLRIVSTMLRSKIKIVGDKEEAKRDYRGANDEPGT